MMVRRFGAAAAALVAMTLVFPAAARADTAHVVSGTVTSGGFVVPGSGVAVCPFPFVNAPAPDCSAPRIIGVDGTGHYSVGLDSGTQFWVIGFVWAGGLLQQSNAQSFVPTGTVPRSSNFDIPAYLFTGVVSRTGFTSFASQTAGVGACPDTPENVGTGAACTGLRAAFAQSNGSYQLVLPPGDWKIAGFILIDGVAVIGTAVETVNVPPTASGVVSRNFSADVAVPDDGDGNPATAGIPAPTTEGGTIGLSSPGGLTLTNVAAAPTSAIRTPPPAGFEFPFGVLSFTAGPVALGATVVIDVTFPQPVPEAAQWYKLDGGAWSVYPNVTRSADNMTLHITLTDGGAGDDDHATNGFVTDPGALGGPPQPTNKDQCKNGGWRTGPYRNQGQCVSHFAAKK